ncbi:DUF2946 domain-containing protein [Pseudomonas cannabina]|nr:MULTISPECIES: DUF2946 domain-containing protein [Pseudomonas syringae group]MBF9245984.1 DUF2946 domain-containing protein [Pseudomonas syringae pv. tomato]MBM0142111.1 DUF2946 domain-containing protein [Pseudomonas cannabina pv. alisalensis]QQN24447.1 DUF2946 domain-containing protein [Pseudomonas cannabina pv. alisalensis]UBY97967.1 DUF2946 domain-containing protein [Pseudomonas cannabina pv. alisalensis]
MKIARNERSLVAWVLYVSILFSSFSCAIGHGQMAGLQLASVGGEYCSLDGNFGADLDDSGLATTASTPGSSCALVSLFSALVLAAFFGLWGLLTIDKSRPYARLYLSRLNRYRWPPANPRASPLGLPLL